MNVYVLIKSVFSCRSCSSYKRNTHLNKFVAKIKRKIVPPRARSTVYAVKGLNPAAFFIKINSNVLFLHKKLLANSF